MSWKNCTWWLGLACDNLAMAKINPYGWGTNGHSRHHKDKPCKSKKTKIILFTYVYFTLLRWYREGKVSLWLNVALNLLWVISSKSVRAYVSKVLTQVDVSVTHMDVYNACRLLCLPNYTTDFNKNSSWKLIRRGQITQNYEVSIHG